MVLLDKSGNDIAFLSTNKEEEITVYIKNDNINSLGTKVQIRNGIVEIDIFSRHLVDKDGYEGAVLLPVNRTMEFNNEKY